MNRAVSAVALGALTLAASGCFGPIGLMVGLSTGHDEVKNVTSAELRRGELLEVDVHHGPPGTAPTTYRGAYVVLRDTNDAFLLADATTEVRIDVLDVDAIRVRRRRSYWLEGLLFGLAIDAMLVAAAASGAFHNVQLYQQK